MVETLTKMHFWIRILFDLGQISFLTKVFFCIFQNKKLPDGSAQIEATELSFKNVNRHHSGTYVCTANNGFGKAVKEKIHVEVEYSPEVEVEEYFIHATETNKVELVRKLFEFLDPETWIDCSSNKDWFIFLKHGLIDPETWIGWLMKHRFIDVSETWIALIQKHGLVDPVTWIG